MVVYGMGVCICGCVCMCVYMCECVSKKAYCSEWIIIEDILIKNKNHKNLRIFFLNDAFSTVKLKAVIQINIS